MKLQGRDEFVRDLAKTAMDFKLKVVYKSNSRKRFHLFPTLREIQRVKKHNTSLLVDFNNILAEQIDSHFSDFKKYNLALELLKNPFDLIL